MKETFRVTVNENDYMDAMIWAKKNINGFWWIGHKIHIENVDGPERLRRSRDWNFRNNDDAEKFSKIWKMVS